MGSGSTKHQRRQAWTSCVSGGRWAVLKKLWRKRIKDISGLETILLIIEIRDRIVENLNIIDRCNLSQISKSVYTSCKDDPYKVKEIDLSGDARVHGENLFLYLKKLTTKAAFDIKLLGLEGTNVEENYVEDIIDKCSKIEVIKVGEKQISKDLLVSFSRKLPLLRELWIANTNFVNINTIRIMTKYLPNIEGLYIQHSKNIDEKCLILISKKLLYLKSLSLRGCDNITDLGLQHLVFQCKLLKYLDVSMTKTMAYPTCIWIAKIAKNLQKIVVSNTRIYDCGSSVLQMKFREKGLDPEKSVVLCKKCDEYCPKSVYCSKKRFTEHAKSHFQEPKILTHYRRMRIHPQ